MLHVDYIYNNNNIYTFVLWLLSYFKSTPQQSLVTFVFSHLLLQHLSPFGDVVFPILFSHRRLFRLFAFAAFSSVSCSIFACSSPLLFRVFSCNLWLPVAFVVPQPLSVALFVCNLGCWMLRLFGCRYGQRMLSIFLAFKNVRGGIGIFVDVLVSCLQWLSR